MADEPQTETDGAVEADLTEPAESSEAAENPLDLEAEIAADYLEELLDIADLDGDIDTYIEGDRAHVSVISESNVLAGDKGEVLDALQELTRLAVMTETGERSRLMLDVAGFRERRRKELMALAADAVGEAQQSHEPVPLAPMNPFERKVVHDAVAAAGLTSESEGEEPDRHVIVLPADFVVDFLLALDYAGRCNSIDMATYGPAEISSVAASGGITLSIRSTKMSVLLVSRIICQRQPPPYSKPTLITP